jgi:Ca-activated chloride channel family protein
LYQSLQKVKQGRYQKKAILLVTDGEDNGSSARYDKTLLDIRESEMLVYCIGIRGAEDFDMSPDPSNDLSRVNGTKSPAAIPQALLNSVDMKVLNGFADTSGGKAWQLNGDANAKDFDKILDGIAAELRSQYSIGYYPATHPVKDGKWHSVRIRMKDPRYFARARKEYFGK